LEDAMREHPICAVGRCNGTGGRAARRRFRGFTVTVLAGLLLAVTASAQVTGLYFQEITKDGRIYVFNTPERYKAFTATGEMGTAITLIGRGPNGETVIAENETAIDLFLFKHNLPAYERPTQPPPKQPLPMTLKVGDGELKFGMLLQAWYVADTSPASTGSSWLGNTTGYNTFRLRRSELRLSGKIAPDWAFEVMIDPAKSQFSGSAPATDSKILQDLAVSYVGLKGYEFALGQKKIYLTEEGSTRSSSETDFAERAQVVRAFSDQRQTGFFFKGDFSGAVAGYFSATNGVPSNAISNTNDTLFFTARLDIKLVSGLMFGVSGASGATGGGRAHLGLTRYAAHVKYDGPDDLPIGFRAEYLQAADGQAGKPDLKRDGYYATFLYTIAKQYQVALRYDTLNNNKDAAGNRTTMTTAGFHYLIKGKNINLKLDYFDIKQDGRKVNGVLAEQYKQAVLAAQIAF
jgi:hypothetical protein